MLFPMPLHAPAQRIATAQQGKREQLRPGRHASLVCPPPTAVSCLQRWSGGVSFQPCRPSPSLEPEGDQGAEAPSGGSQAWAESRVDVNSKENMNHSPFISSKQACNYQGLGSPLLRGNYTHRNAIMGPAFYIKQEGPG